MFNGEYRCGKIMETELRTLETTLLDHPSFKDLNLY